MSLYRTEFNRESLLPDFTTWLSHFVVLKSTDKLKQHGAFLVPQFHSQKKLESLYTSAVWDWGIWTNPHHQRSFICCFVWKQIFHSMIVYTSAAIFQINCQTKTNCLIFTQHINPTKYLRHCKAHSASHLGQAVQWVQTRPYLTFSVCAQMPLQITLWALAVSREAFTKCGYCK